MCIFKGQFWLPGPRLCLLSTGMRDGHSQGPSVVFGSNKQHGLWAPGGSGGDKVHRVANCDGLQGQEQRSLNDTSLPDRFNGFNGFYDRFEKQRWSNVGEKLISPPHSTTVIDPEHATPAKPQVLRTFLNECLPISDRRFFAYVAHPSHCPKMLWEPSHPTSMCLYFFSSCKLKYCMKTFPSLSTTHRNKGPVSRAFIQLPYSPIAAVKCSQYDKSDAPFSDLSRGQRDNVNLA